MPHITASPSLGPKTDHTKRHLGPSCNLPNDYDSSSFRRPHSDPYSVESDLRGNGQWLSLSSSLWSPVRIVLRPESTEVLVVTRIGGANSKAFSSSSMHCAGRLRRQVRRDLRVAASCRGV